MKTNKEVKNTRKSNGLTDSHVIHVHTTNDFFFENENYSVIKDYQNPGETTQ